MQEAIRANVKTVFINELGCRLANFQSSFGTHENTRKENVRKGDLDRAVEGLDPLVRGLQRPTCTTGGGGSMDPRGGVDGLASSFVSSVDILDLSNSKGGFQNCFRRLNVLYLIAYLSIYPFSSCTTNTALVCPTLFYNRKCSDD